MLMLAEATISARPEPDEVAALQAWLGPMVDSGFLQSGFLDIARNRLWMVLSSESVTDAVRRLDDLPAARTHAVTFSVTPVTALRFR